MDQEYQSVYTVKRCSDCQCFSDYCSYFTDGYDFMDLSTAECGCDHRRAGHFPAGASPCTGAAGRKKDVVKSDSF